MKKVIYFVGVIIALVSGSFIFAEDEDSEKRIGNVGAYEQVLIASSEECIKNTMKDWAPQRSIECRVQTRPWKDNDEKLYIHSNVSADVPFKKDSTVHISAWASSSSSYWIKAYVMDMPLTISREEFSGLIEKLIKEKGAELPIKYLKIEKQ